MMRKPESGFIKSRRSPLRFARNRKFIPTIPVRVAAVRNIKSAAAGMPRRKVFKKEKIKICFTFFLNWNRIRVE